MRLNRRAFERVLTGNCFATGLLRHEFHDRIRKPARRRRSSIPTFPPGSTGCPGAASTRWWWSALGVTWILDGLEVTLAGAVSGALKDSPVLQFSNTDVGIAASAYLAGAVLGALFFGWLTDRLGRKKLFFITLAVYLVATAATAFTWNLWTLRRSAASSPAPASAANTPPSIPPSRS